MGFFGRCVISELGDKVGDRPCRMSQLSRNATSVTDRDGIAGI